MTTIRDIAAFLEGIAPLELAEDWDNVGLLVGERTAAAARIMTCLTITDSAVEEACQAGANLIVSHHPLPFRPLQQITSDNAPGRLLLKLIAAGVAVFSAHTAFDSAKDGINQQLAEGLQLENIGPLIQHAEQPDLGSGRWGILSRPMQLNNVAQRAADFLRIEAMHLVGEDSRQIQRVAVACGSAGELLAAAALHGCDALLLGETSFHTCLDAQSRNLALILVGHYPSERFAVERLAEQIAERFPSCDVWASRHEDDPVRWITVER